MNVLTRGIRNAFRNSTRTFSIVVILGLSIGLSLTMLIARQAVNTKINQVKASVGNTITIAPAGFSGFSQVNNALSTTELTKVASLSHVSNLTEGLTGRLSTTGTSQPSFGFGGGQSTNNSTTSTISLTSPVTLNSGSFGGGGRSRLFNAGGGSLPTNFSLPISMLGTSNPSSIDGNTITIQSGTTIDGNKDVDSALVSASMASKNNLKVGSTFTAYNTTITVAGIFKTSNQAIANDVVLSLPTEQRLSGQTGDVTSAVATVDSLDNLGATTTAIKNTLGSSADVTSAQTQADAAVAPLNNVKNISLYSLIGAVIAGGIIILMTMIMIVRERKREIGVIKAIGGSNIRIVFQFMAEALTLTILGAAVGLIIGFVGANPVTNTLVTNSANSTTTASTTADSPGGFRQSGGGSRFGGAGRFIGENSNGGFASRNFGTKSTAGQDIHNIHTEIGWSILAYGFGAAILIALIGSALAAGLIAKVRPSEVMRAE
jgi:putative ABC transport system permease protein